MQEIKLLTPKEHIETIGNLRFKKFKVLRDSAKPYAAAKYALHKCFLAKYTSSSSTAKEWAPLYSQLMGSIAGNNKQWKLVKNILVEAGYLECDNKCKHYIKSFGFRLGPLLQDTDWDYSTHDLRIADDNRPQMEWLGIDKVKAHHIIDKLAVEKSWDSRTTKGWHTRVDNFRPGYQICTTGRAYSDANQLPKSVRDTLLIDGEPTAEIDIVNCQPLLLASIYPTRSDEWERYKNLAEKGKVYEALGGFANLSRDDAKNQFIPFIFGSTKPTAKEFFKEKFPELLEAIGKRRQTSHKALARELQNKESGIIVERVCEEFKAASIHDGVRVKFSDVEAVKVFIESKFLELWGLIPKLTVEFSNSPDESKVA
jgi:hypothetical protein